jgi:hypothetical protein
MVDTEVGTMTMTMTMTMTWPVRASSAGNPTTGAFSVTVL